MKVHHAPLIYDSTMFEYESKSSKSPRSWCFTYMVTQIKIRLLYAFLKPNCVWCSLKLIMPSFRNMAIWNKRFRYGSPCICKCLVRQCHYFHFMHFGKHDGCKVHICSYISHFRGKNGRNMMSCYWVKPKLLPNIYL